MAALSAFYPYIKPYCIGAPQPLIDQTLRDVADDFCRRSESVRATLAGIPVSAATSDYALTPPENCDIHEPVDVVLEVGTQRAPLEPGRPERRDLKDTGRPVEYWQPTPGVLRIHPTPKTAGTLEVEVSVKPVQGASVLPDQLLTEWRTAIAAGALARIYAVPGQAYSAPENVASYQGIFEEGVEAARQQAKQGRVRARLRVRSCP